MYAKFTCFKTACRYLSRRRCNCSDISATNHVNQTIKCEASAVGLRSLTANQVQSVPGRSLNFGGSSSSSHRPWTGTLNRWSSLSTFYRETYKNPRTSRRVRQSPLLTVGAAHCLRQELLIEV